MNGGITRINKGGSGGCITEKQFKIVQKHPGFRGMNILSYFKSVKAFVFDVDGVLTDGTLLILSDGQMARRMNIKDGYALQLAIKKGYKVLIISGGNSADVKDRLMKLKVTDVFMQVVDKKEILLNYISEKNISGDEILFMGDDVPDYPCMQLVALPCCPVDAVAEVKRVSKYISPFKGGEGCVRDVIEKVLRLHGNWDADMQSPPL